MSKNKEREGRSSKAQRKEGKSVKVNKTRGNDNKLVGVEKAGKQDDASKKFPNFSLLSEEERQVFFEALTTARKNLEKKGVPTRQRFGTVHDEYLNHFDRNVKTEQEGDSEKPAPREPNTVLENKVSPLRDGSTAFVPQGGDPSQKNISSDKLKTIPTFCAQLPLSEIAKPKVLDQCESVILQNTNRIIDLYIKRKKKNEKKFEIPVPEKRGRPEKEKGNQAKENVRKLLVVGKTPKTRNTPRFDALSPEEKEVFFNILDEARNNVVEKNPEKKHEILPLDSIARMYQGCRRTTNTSEKAHRQEQEKNLNVKVTLTSGDVRRIKKKSEKKVEEQRSEERAKDVKEDKREEGKGEEDKKEEGKGEEDKREEGKGEEDKREEGKGEEDKREEGKGEEGKGEEDKREEGKGEEDKREEDCLKPEDKLTTESIVKECGDTSEMAEEASKNFNVEEVEASEKELKASQGEEKSKEEGGHSQDSKVGMPDEGNAEISSKQSEVERAERKGNEKSKENGMEKSSIDEDNSEKEFRKFPKTDSVSQVAEEESEEGQKRAKTASSSSSIFPKDAGDSQGGSSSSRTKEFQETESVVETDERGYPQTPQEKEAEKLKTFSTPKVMFVEDNVIDKIRNLIFYLEAKARKDDRLEKEYIKLLVDYVDYLSRVLEALVLKKNHQEAPFQLPRKYIDAEVHLKFTDDPTAQKAQGISSHHGPRSVSGHNIGGNFLSGLSEENVTEKVTETESKINVTLSHSETSVTSGISEEAAFLPPLTGNKKVGITKIRLLQDLLKKRAEIVEGSTEDLKIVHHPEEEYIPVERPPSMKAITSESEEHAREDHRVKFLKFLTKCFTCGKKKEEEYGVFENLKGEAVRVVVTEGKNKDPANATLNQSVMEVLKAAGRKKVIEKFYGTA